MNEPSIIIELDCWRDIVWLEFMDGINGRYQPWPYLTTQLTNTEANLQDLNQFCLIGWAVGGDVGRLHWKCSESALKVLWNEKKNKLNEAYLIKKNSSANVGRGNKLGE